MSQWAKVQLTWSQPKVPSLRDRMDIVNRKYAQFDAVNLGGSRSQRLSSVAKDEELNYNVAETERAMRENIERMESVNLRIEHDIDARELGGISMDHAETIGRLVEAQAHAKDMDPAQVKILKKRDKTKAHLMSELDKVKARLYSGGEADAEKIAADSSTSVRFKIMKAARAKAALQAMTRAKDDKNRQLQLQAWKKDYGSDGKYKTSFRLSAEELDDLSAENLTTLKIVFFAAKGEEDGLTEDEFVDLFQQIMSLDEDKARSLFWRIDDNADGSLSWEEFLSYLLLEGTTKMANSLNRGISKVEKGPVCPISHSEMISRVIYCPGWDVLVTMGRDRIFGTLIEMWNADTMEHRYTVRQFKPETGHTRPPHVKVEWEKLREKKKKDEDMYVGRQGRGLRTEGGRVLLADTPKDRTKKEVEIETPRMQTYNHGTDVLFYEGRNQLIVSSMDRLITYYDFKRDARGNILTAEGKSFATEREPICMSMFTHIENNRSMLLIGDLHGWCTSYDVLTHEVDKKKHHHTEAVTQVEYIYTVGIVSTGLDRKVVVMHPLSWEIVWQSTGREHNRGISAFGYSHKYRCLMTGGLDGNLILWDAFAGRVALVLHGHSDGIVDLKVNDQHNHCVTISQEKHMRVWDLRQQRCVQSLYDDSTHIPHNELRVLLLDTTRQRMITGGSSLRAWKLVMPRDHEDEQVTNSMKTAHPCTVKGLAYSKGLKQLVSIGIDGGVRLWNMQTGTCTFEFRANHIAQFSAEQLVTEEEPPEPIPITAFCLDHRERRLITGAHNGTLRVWNFNSGEMVHEFEERNGEVSSVIYVDGRNILRPVVSVGWDRCLTMYPDQGQDYKPMSVLTCHTMDVLSVANCKGGRVVTAGADGVLVVWSLETGLAVTTQAVPRRSSDIRVPLVEQMISLDSANLIAVSTDAGDIHLVCGVTGSILREFAVHCGDNPTMCLTLDEKTMYIANGRGTFFIVDANVTRRDVSNFKIIHKWNGFKARVTSLAMTAEPSLLVAGMADGAAHVYTPEGDFFASLGSYIWQPGEWEYRRPMDDLMEAELRDRTYRKRSRAARVKEWLIPKKEPVKPYTPRGKEEKPSGTDYKYNLEVSGKREYQLNLMPKVADVNEEFQGLIAEKEKERRLMDEIRSLNFRL